MLTFAFMHYPYLVHVLFGMPSLHLFTSLVGANLSEPHTSGTALRNVLDQIYHALSHVLSKLAYRSRIVTRIQDVSVRRPSSAVMISSTYKKTGINRDV